MKPYVELGSDEIRRLNREGLRASFEPLQIRDEAVEASTKMPEGKIGLVLGSGPNTGEWRGRGWATLDIDPVYGSDFVEDANYLDRKIPPNSCDYVFAECIKFDPLGHAGVAPARLLEQANRVLKPGGLVIISSATKYNKPGNTLPRREVFAPKMLEHGFRAVVENHELRTFDMPGQGEVVEQAVVYYGQKVAEGYSPVQRVETIF